MLTNNERRTIEYEWVNVVRSNSNGINTRTGIAQVMTSVSNRIPNANRHHVSGMIAWIMKKYGFRLIVRSPGYSIIA